jgi:hypothetical protein
MRIIAIGDREFDVALICEPPGNILRVNDFIDVFSVDPEKDSRDQGLRRI